MIDNKKIFTIGFTGKSAERFFSLIKQSGTTKIIDTRLNNSSQLSGFSKKNDLKYFLNEICEVEYEHIPDLAPTKEILSKYKKNEIGWELYEEQFLNIMSIRNIEKHIQKTAFDCGCLLCSEHSPDRCHRRLVAEYLNKSWHFEAEIIHLK